MLVKSAVNFKYVNYLWDEKKAASMAGDETALLIYRSNLLGSDLRLTNYGGGNTSCKGVATDPLTSKPTRILWVKGSGGDLASLKHSGLAALYLDRVLDLEKVYRGIEFEDEMVALLDHCIYDFQSKAPSIDTPLHAFLPFVHIDHLHPDAAIAIAASRDGKKITKELFEGKLGWVDWQRPGFDLGLKLRYCLNQNPGIRGIMLGSHGLFTWGDTAYESYINTLQVVESCSEFIDQQLKKRKYVFGGEKIKPPDKKERHQQAASIVPILRGLCSSSNKMVAHYNDEEIVMEFINSYDLYRFAPMGTSCPDHFLRTKVRPMILELDPLEDVSGGAIKEKLENSFTEYRKMYRVYYEDWKNKNTPPIRDQNPVVILYPGIGMFTFAKDKATARIAAEFYVNAINVMKGASAISEYTSLHAREAFNIEYWVLEEAKLQRMPKPRPLSGKIAFVTGGAGGIGKAIAKKFMEEGACVVINDRDTSSLNSTAKEFSTQFGKDAYSIAPADVTKEDDISGAFSLACIAFGGVDIIVNCAGLSISKPLEEHTEKDWDLLYDVLVKGQFLITRAAVNIMRKQNMGGDIVNIVSKNALVSGPNNAAYGSAKAAQLHLSRLNAAELGADNIRVNVVNPDAVIADSKIWQGEWAEGRAKAYGVKVDELPAFYAKRTLLNEIILPEDIAKGCFAFVSGLLNKSTGNVLNIDGGIPGAFVR